MTSTATVAVPAASAEEMLPELEDLGFSLTESGPDPGMPPFDSAVALYRGAESPQQQIQVRIYVLPNVEAAATQFDAFADALRNPPPEFLGGVQAKFVDTESPELGETRKSYRTETPTTQGYTAYTDLYRQGRTVVLVQVVESTEDGMPARQEVGERALAGAP